MLNSEIKNIYFIGIGGAGMMPLAIHCKKLGYNIFGSDLCEDSFKQLNRFNIFPSNEQNSDLLEIDLVVYSSAVKEDNLEFATAKENGLKLYKRAEMVGFLTKQSHSILVSGSHGKSTTSVMLSDILYNNVNYNASAIIGAESVSQNSNYYDGAEKYLIVEADEYDKSFLKMYPNDLILLNIDNDHLDIYGNINGLIDGFSELVSKLNNESILIYNRDDKNVLEAVKNINCKSAGFGLIERELNKDKKYYFPKDIKYKDFRTSFKLYWSKENKSIGEFSFNYTGDHNLYNFIAAIVYCIEVGISYEEIVKLSYNFIGLKRRQEIIFNNEDCILMDDYAHHPTEIINSIRSVKENYKKGRIIILFQPHLYSRTLDQYREFAKSFDNVEKIYMSHIYPARETNENNITSELIYNAMNIEVKEKTRVYDNFEKLYSDVISDLKKGDFILALGAGEINKVLYKIKNYKVELENS